MLATRRLTAAELVAICYARQEQERLNAVVVRLRAEAISAATSADLALAGAGPQCRSATGSDLASQPELAKPLRGIPVTVKLTIDVAGSATEGSKLIPVRDAVVVALLRRAGAIVIGKTNCPPGEADVDTYGSFGRTLNPWDAQVSPGGSSGGGAAAVAAGHTVADVGSDYAGSLRIPAACCGVFAYRPTPGVIPDLGHSFAANPRARDRGIGVLGPIAGSAGDLSILAGVLAGQVPFSRPLALAGLRIAAWFDRAGPYCPAADVLAVARSAVGFLTDLGLRVPDAAPRFDLERHWQVFLRLIYLAEREHRSGLPERAAQARESEPLNLAAAGEAAASPPGEAALAGSPRADPLAVPAGCDALDALAWAQTASAGDGEQLALAVSAIRSEWASFFASHDLLITPMLLDSRLPMRDLRVPLVADEYYVGGTRRAFIEATVWASLASLSGLPAISMPAGSAPDGMPVGLQVLAAPGKDALLIEAARLLEGVWPRPRLPEGPLPALGEPA